MATEISTQRELYELMKSEIESLEGDYTDFSDGSMLDIALGAYTTGMNEISELIISEFKKTYFETAHGPEVTGLVDDLQNLAVDHFGDSFKRPQANESTGSVTFSRPNTDEGDITVFSGSILKTKKDDAGNEILFETTEDLLIDGLTAIVSVVAQVAGIEGNVDIGKVIVIDTPLSDTSITVSNTEKFAGGENEEDDANYRETIRNLIQSLAGATKSAVEGTALSVAGVSIVTLQEIERIVIDYDIAMTAPVVGASYFRIPYPVIYVADENGSSSQALIQSVIDSLEFVRACGVKIEVRGATAFSLSWDGSFSLNAGGPNFGVLQSDFSIITDSMSDYINEINIGNSFIRTNANDYIMSIYGPSGTNDLTSFNTNFPVSNVSVQPTEKLISGTMSIGGVVC